VCRAENNEKITISNSHMGDTECFYIYDLTAQGKCSFIEKRKNEFIDMEHSKQEKMMSIINLLKDAQVLTAAQKSPNFIKIAKNKPFQPVIVKSKTLPDIAAELASNFNVIAQSVQARETGLRPPVIEL
jgi:predicted Fe-Mo cluster-binding NifX family protein